MTPTLEESTILNDLSELIKAISRHSITIPLHVEERINQIAVSPAAQGKTRHEVKDAFVEMLILADDPTKPALIPSLIRKEYIPAR